MLSAALHIAPGTGRLASIRVRLQPRREPPNRRARQSVIRLLLIALAITLLAVESAAADQVEITAQAKAARADFLLRATPPGPAAAICVVDTGVNANPDTPGVIGRFALEGDVYDGSPSLHGTVMAMYIGAPSNGYGMVGLWPSARILSVRAHVPGQDAFTPARYIHGVKRCDDVAEIYGVKVILLALSSDYALNESEHAELTDAVLAARLHGMNVIAAAGNRHGRPVGTPGNVSGIVSVGASDSGSGSLCSFSATGALLLSPGCSLDGAHGGTGQPVTNQYGTSIASAIAAAGLAALRTWRPDLTPDDADRLLNETATPSEWGRRLDLTAAFTAAGFGQITQPPAAPSAPAPAATPPQPQPQAQLPKPKFSVRWRGKGAKRTLVAHARNRPRGARLTIRVYARGRGGKMRRVASRTRSSSIVTIHLRSWRRVTAAFTDPSGQRPTSPTAVLRRTR